MSNSTPSVPSQASSFDKVYLDLINFAVQKWFVDNSVDIIWFLSEVPNSSHKNRLVFDAHKRVFTLSSRL